VSFFLAVCFLLLGVCPQAQSVKPYLRIETVAHAAVVNHIDVDAAEQCVQVDTGGELVDVQRVDHELNDALRGFLGEHLCRVGHSPADRPQPITRIHALSMPRHGVRRITRRG